MQKRALPSSKQVAVGHHKKHTRVVDTNSFIAWYGKPSSPVLGPHSQHARAFIEPALVAVVQSLAPAPMSVVLVLLCIACEQSSWTRQWLEATNSKRPEKAKPCRLQKLMDCRWPVLLLPRHLATRQVLQVAAAAEESQNCYACERRIGWKWFQQAWRTWEHLPGLL